MLMRMHQNPANMMRFSAALYSVEVLITIARRGSVFLASNLLQMLRSRTDSTSMSRTALMKQSTSHARGLTSLSELRMQVLMLRESSSILSVLSTSSHYLRIGRLQMSALTFASSSASSQMLAWRSRTIEWTAAVNFWSRVAETFKATLMESH